MRSDSPAPSLADKQRQVAVEEIVRAAVDLFSRDGFHSTTVEAIAAEAGCSRRTFYRYFDAKEDVMFHDQAAGLERLREILDGRLAAGVGMWEAVTESVVEMLGWFSAVGERTVVTRMVLRQSEPALRARYLLYVSVVERTIADCLCRHRGTRPERDDLAQAMAITAIGAYRATLTTQPVPATGSDELTTRLRELLATLGGDLSRS